MIILSSPGKVILHGEHAVVYGKSAIAASLNLRSIVHLVRTDDDNVIVELLAVGLKQCWNVGILQEMAEKIKVDLQNPSTQSDDIIRAITKLCLDTDADTSSTKLQAAVAFVYLYIAICGRNDSLPSISLKVTSKLPVGAGLGSSASFSVCLAAALLLEQGLIAAPQQDDFGSKQWREDDLDLINKWAYQGERIIHGNPSGIDNAVATFGGAIKFQAGKITKLNKEVRSIQRNKRYNEYWTQYVLFKDFPNRGPLQRIPRLRILLTSTGVPRSTKEMVSGVRDRYDRFPEVLQPIMDAVEAVTEHCEKLFNVMSSNPEESHTDVYAKLQELIDINQHVLQAIGVSHVTLDKICDVTYKYGLHSKLTGAGGGGCAFTLLRPDIGDSVLCNIIEELETEGFSCFATEVGSVGVMLHDSLPEYLT